MLTVYFHIGPHKTGTTSIQQYLRRTIGSEEPQQVWYPMTSGASPGHVKVFKDMSGRNDEYLGLMDNLVKQSNENGVKKLIISQEDFCKSDADLFERLRKICNGVRVHLIMTHRPIGRRVVSRWQEKIKHGETNTINDLGELLEDSEFSSDLLWRTRKHLKPEQVSIVTSGNGESGDRLINRFVDCLDIHEYIQGKGAEIDSNTVINVSHGRVEVEFIRHLNIMSRYLDEVGVEHDYKFMRRMLVNTMLTPRWKEKMARIKIEFPAEWEGDISRLAKNTFDLLYQDFHAGKINVYGDLNHLLQ